VAYTLSWYLDPAKMFFTLQFSKSDFSLEFVFFCSEIVGLQIFTILVLLVDHTTKVQGVPKLVV
jgi:hypothetical protein